MSPNNRGFPHQTAGSWCVRAMPRAPAPGSCSPLPHGGATHTGETTCHLTYAACWPALRLPLCCVEHWAWRERCYPFWVSVSERALTDPMPCCQAGRTDCWCRTVELTAAGGEEGGLQGGFWGVAAGLQGGSGFSEAGGKDRGVLCSAVELFCGTRSRQALDMCEACCSGAGPLPGHVSGGLSNEPKGTGSFFSAALIQSCAPTALLFVPRSFGDTLQGLLPDSAPRLPGLVIFFAM